MVPIVSHRSALGNSYDSSKNPSKMASQTARPLECSGERCGRLDGYLFAVNVVETGKGSSPFAQGLSLSAGLRSRFANLRLGDPKNVCCTQFAALTLA